MQVRTTLAAEPASAGAARQYVSSMLTNWGCTDLDDIAVLLVSELVTNALLHAGPGEILLTLTLGAEEFRVEVRDASQRAPQPRHYSSESGTGRGLMLIGDLASDWGVDPDADGKTVWFSLALDSAHTMDQPQRQAR